MLKWEEFVDHAPSNVGAARVNHTSERCSGESKSLRVERREDGTITAKCFRCGETGYYAPEHRRCTVKTEEKKASVSRFELGTLEYDSLEWPMAASSWLYRYGITTKEITNNRIAYSALQKRIVLPTVWKDETSGYQLRRIYDTDQGPKYITVQRNATPHMSITGSLTGLVICEDIVSSIKISRVQKTMALLSTSIRPEHLAYVTEMYDKFWIWLDMDNAQVIRGAVKLMKVLELFGSVKLLRTPKDPKYYNSDDIERLLYGT